jgi:hypothetical protein
MSTPIDREKLLSLGVISRRSGNRVAETRDGNGRPVKATTDEAGNTVTEHWHDRQDVTVRPHTVRLVREGRDEPAR